MNKFKNSFKAIYKDFSKFFLHRYKPFFPKINFNIVMILFSAFIFRLFLSNFGTLQLDHGTFVAWSNSLASSGLSNFYSGWSDYLPGYLYVLWILGKLNLLFPSLETILYKLPAIFADLGTGYLIYIIVCKLKNKKWAIVSSLLYLFNPAIFANSSLWGQVDSLTSLFSMFAIYLASQNKKFFSAVILTIGTLIKPQAAFVLPVIFHLSLVNKWKVKDVLLYGLVGLSTFIAGFIPFKNITTAGAQNISGLFNFILERLTISSGQYKYGSVNAYSFWGIFGFWKPDNITFWIGLVITLTLVSISLFIFRKRKNFEYNLSALILLTSFLFMTRMHERHLLPVLAPLLITAVNNPAILIVYLGLSITYLSNLTYAYYWITENYKEIFNPFLIKLFISINLSLFLLYLITLFKRIKINFKFKINRLSLLNQFDTKDISNKKAKILLSIILLFGLLTRIYSLGIPKDMYFDEIYHSFTAKLVLHNDPKAWEFWNPNPEGYAYEWTHPPLSKLGMVVGMTIFGENPFGWRIPQAVLGTLSIFLIYLLAYEIFKDKLSGILSAAIFTLDGLPLVLSRMGMNDSYVLFFSLCSVYLFITASNAKISFWKDAIKDRNFLSSIMFGLALASKWSAVYVFPIIFISHFVFKKKIKMSYLSFLIIPIAIYIASYGVLFKTGHSWGQFIEVQKQMWWYHTNLVAEHPYTSPAWSWPLLLRPIYLYDGQEINGMVARIYAFGNPLVFWFGLFSIILGFVISAQEKNKKLGFVIFSYLILFLPWIASPRIMFLYHYLPSIPFLSIATGYILRRFYSTRIYILAIGLVLFIYFYPHWIGMRIPVWLDNSYYWFASWR